MGYEIDSLLRDIIDFNIQNFDIDEANRSISDRFQRHISFVNDRELAKKEVKHYNEKLGCKVMTGQESDLIFHFIKEVSRQSSDDIHLGYEATYFPDRPLIEIPFRGTCALFSE